VSTLPARGKGLSAVGSPPAAEQPAAPKPRRRAWWRVRLVAFVTLPLLVLDQVSKLYVAAHMQLYENIPIIPHWLAITYTLNPGAAFSIFTDLSPAIRLWFLVSLEAAASIVLLVLIVRSERFNMTVLAFALILAGALGNLIDRGVRGRVIDFIRVHYYSLNYPIFNVADSAITVGVVLIILGMFVGADTRKE
jgi:signal peptidase II